MRILLVEDNPDHAAIFKAYLGMTSYANALLIQREKLSDALKLLHEAPVDIVFLDLSLKDSNIAQTFDRLREFKALCPVVVNTSLDDKTTLLEAIARGADDCLPKGELSDTLLERTIRFTLDRWRLRKELTESENRLQSILDNSPSVIYMKQTDGRYMLINKQWESLFDTTNEMMKGKLDSDFFPKNIADAFMANDRQVIETGEPWVTEEIVPHNDGLHTYISVKFPLRNHLGSIYAMAGISTDITERKKHEEEIHKLSLAIEQSPISVVITDFKGNIEFVNRKFQEVTGYTREELMGQNSRALKSGFHPQEFYKSLWCKITSGETWQGEFYNKKKNNEFFWEKALISPIKNSKGVITHFIGLKEDVTLSKQIEAELLRHRERLEELVEVRTQQLTLENMERKQAEELLARTLREQESIFSSNPDIVFVADVKGCLVKWNKQLEVITDYAGRELILRKFASLFPSDESGLVDNTIEKIIRSGRGDMEAHLLCKSGALIPYHFIGVTLHNESGEVIGLTGTGRDITERLASEKQTKNLYEQLIHSEKLSALGKLTGSIAHEFNNPIYGIQNIIELIRESEGMSQDSTELLSLALRECSRMASLVRNLQGFYKPSDDKKTSIDIHQLLVDIEVLSKKKLAVKGINLIKNYHTGLPKVYAVGDQIRQVLLNLMNNAEEAIAESGGTITITTEIDGPNIKVHVLDTGEGISEENLKLVFDPFFSTKGIKGTGLGLSVSYGIVKAHGGELSVASKRGKGSTFTMVLPVHQDNP